ncbi:type I polyketide synthase [Maribacter thermophilus]|uniref:type I polyketide synthase n=1 Tax=Maribacter thermophilus TaxID=1197874 RepID=UPI000640C8A6|nr:type I polyketide synthase [Maribacter thermophilus]
MDASQKKLLEQYKTLNDTFVSYPEVPLHDLVSKQALMNPERTAIEFHGEKTTFHEFDQKSNQLANYLLSIGTKPGDLIGVCLPRSGDVLITFIAIMKCGATYVPLDPAHPSHRLEFMLSDSDAKFLITTTELSEIFSSDHKKILKDQSIEKIEEFSTDSPKIAVAMDTLVYMIYTSGSTGQPKGVPISHKNLVNVLCSMIDEPGITEEDRILAINIFSFDMCGVEIYAPLVKGACIVMADNDMVLDNHVLLNIIINEKITFMQATPTRWQLILNAGWGQRVNLKALTGGEPISKKLANELLDRCTSVWNMYGPTETTIWSSLKRIERDDEIITVGKSIANTAIYILGKNGELVPSGTIGEIAIAGTGTAIGYWKRPDLTEEKFIENTFQPEKGKVLYKTGDLGKILPNGEIQCLGRIDQQVKVRGHRIELGEIEAFIDKLPHIQKSIVVVNTSMTGEPQLVSYIKSDKKLKDMPDFHKKIREMLPDYMVPSFYVQVDEFSKTASGKIDRNALPEPKYERPDYLAPFVKPSTKYQKLIAEVWLEVLRIPSIGIDDNFFEIGGTSILGQKAIVILQKKLNTSIPITKLYQFPTIRKLAAHLEIPKKKNSTKKSQKGKTEKNLQNHKDIAVIGMAGRFPGAQSVQELWDVLLEGRETTSFFTAEEIDKNIPEAIRKDPLYVPARGVVPSAKEFDSKFFGLNPRLALAMDPQQRLFMEISWEVLEQTGYLPRHYDGSVGVYAGCGYNTYYINNVIPNKDLLDQVGEFVATTVNDKDYIATRTAYHLNLKGPAISVHSACSTSLLAIAEATEALRTGQCDVALAGAASVTSPMNSGHLYQEGAIKTPTGHCCPFDENGKGTVFSDGAGVVLLKTLEDAERDGDTIYGVIKGIGLSNDGGEKGSFTAPSAEGQSQAIINALDDAQISPSEISYVEAHGTATPVGDPIEIEGLEMAFGEQEKKNFCAVGSIKSNMGHLTSAAGVAGFIKTILAMYHKQIPASLGYSKPNPLIDFENNPFFVNNVLRNWDVEGKRKAGISSFGVGGTNVHVVVEEYENKTKTSDEGRPVQLLTWSAKSQKSLDGYQKALGDHIDKAATPLADIAYSLNVTRDIFNNRSFVVAGQLTEASEKLLSENSKDVKSNSLRTIPSELGFLFPGQGSQYLQMGKELYENESVFKEAVDTCADILLNEFQLDIRNVIFPETNNTESEERLKDTKYTQPALFVIEYALSQLWLSWSIKPTFLCGHSIGEFVAAHVAGVFTLTDALRLITVRGKLVSELPGGSMLSARTSVDNLSKIIPETLSIAAVNSDQLCVISGPDKEIENFAQQLKADGIANMLLATSHAFHSTMMEPILDVFEKEVRKVSLKAPNIPMISTVTGTWLSDTDATNPKYWTDHLRDTVRFSDAMDTILNMEDDALLLEIGPGRALTTLAHQKKGEKTVTAISSLPLPKKGENSYQALLTALGQLWLKGIEPNWKEFYKDQSRQKVLLPSYVYDRKPCWIDPPASVPQFIDNSTIEENIIQQESPVETKINQSITNMRKENILQKISEIILKTSGIELEAGDTTYNFLELGLDSLVLTQMATTCKREFDTAITFRQLSDELNTPELLANYLDEVLPEESFAPEPAQPISIPVQQAVNNTSPTPVPQSIPQSTVTTGNHYINNTDNTAVSLIAQQLQLLGKQLDLLQGNGTMQNNPVQNQPVNPVTPNTVQNNGSFKAPLTASAAPSNDSLSEEEKKELKKPFGASPKIEKQPTEITPEHQAFLEKLIKRYNKKTASSKAYSQKHRSYMADPRVVSGFKPATKELVYPIVIERSSGNRLWDLDGNEYIDALNGFGAGLFGHQPDFIKEVLHKQVDLGFEVGPQHPLAGEVCKLLCEFTGHDRAALCNTGSEAVLGAVRIARTVTGRSLIVSFAGSYHGINDEALVRGSKKLKTFPAAAGILSDSVQNVLVLEYGTEESLRIIKERANEIAAVLVEPVQSRRPEFQPIEFLKKVREVTTESETVLIFDEIITGFRTHPGGAQALFGIKADIATYGKVIGGGISIGAILGKRQYMDALDGGFWQYGDDSFPEVGVTYFAGTFVRHPLALATTKASLNFMKEKGPELQKGLSEMTEGLAIELNKEFTKRKLPIQVNYYASLWRLKIMEDIPYSELLFVLLREKGIHIMDGFPCYMTIAYTQEDIRKIIDTILESIDELIEVGIFKSETNGSATSNGNKSSIKSLNTPPVEGARLGMDESGNPAWFVEDQKKNGSYVKFDI